MRTLSERAGGEGAGLRDQQGGSLMRKVPEAGRHCRDRLVSHHSEKSKIIRK